MFKLICGLGNLDIENIKALVKLYAKAGAWMFDVSPFALWALNEAIAEENLNPDNFKYCVSIPLEGDVHGKKAKILSNKCKKCSKCAKKCPQGAISNFIVDEKKCIGCGICKKVCSCSAVKMHDKTDYFDKLNEILKSDLKLDCVELHASVGDKKHILKKLKKISKKFKGDISLCISRKYFSLNQATQLISEAKEIVSDNSAFYIQADGNSMNGANKELSSTIECVAFALALKESGVDENTIILSGGTNEYTKKLCDELSLKPLSIAFGTYARKNVCNLDDNAALEFAKKLVGALGRV